MCACVEIDATQRSPHIQTLYSLYKLYIPHTNSFIKGQTLNFSHKRSIESQLPTREF